MIDEIVESASDQQPTPEAEPVAEATGIWPAAKAINGQIYAVRDANGETMVAMTMDTWNRVQGQLKDVTQKLEYSNAENVLMKRQLLLYGQGSAGQKKIILPGLS